MIYVVNITPGSGATPIQPQEFYVQPLIVSAPSFLQPLAGEWPLIPGPAPIDQTWVWNQTRMLGADQFPTGGGGGHLAASSGVGGGSGGGPGGQSQAGGSKKKKAPAFGNEWDQEVHRWEWWYNLNLIGKDILPVGRPGNAGQLGLPQAPPRLEYTWTLNLQLTTLAVAIQNPFIAQVYDLTPKPPQRLPYYGTEWRQVGMLGQDQLPVGEQSTDLTPRAPSRAPYYGAEWRQVFYLGADRLPTGKQIYELTPRQLIPRPIDPTWVWRQVGMLGQDQLPTGDQIYDLVPKPPSRLPYYGTEWRQVGMLGMDRLPVGEVVYDLAPKGPYRIEQTWTWRQVGMLGQDVLPTGDQITDLTPKPASRLPLYTWEWRQVGMLGQDKLPVGEQIYDLTGRPYRIDQTWALNLQTTTLSAVAFPFNQYDWPLSARPIRIDQTWALSSTAYIPVITLPHNQYDWPLTPAPRRIEETWVVNLTTMIGKDVLPLNQFDWPLPGRPSRIEQTTTWNQTPMLGKDQLPIGDQIYDLWTKAAKPIEQTWIWRQVDKLGKDILPANQFDWPLPKTPLWWSSYRDWEWNQTPMLGKDVLPFNQFDWPVPRGPYRIDQSWSLSLQFTTLIPTFNLPFNQFDWPLTPAPKRIDETWTWSYNINLIGKDQLPFRQQDWPLPGRPPRIEQTTVWNQTPMLGRDQLPVGEQVYDLWVKGPKPIEQSWAWNQIRMLGQDTLPKNQFDWQVPRPSRTPDYRSWEWRQVGMLGQDILPTGEQIYDRPVPAPLRAIELYNWVQSVNLSLTTAVVYPANFYGREDGYSLPPRGPQQPALSWTWRQVDKLGLDQLPVGKQAYDRTVPAPVRAIDLYSWIQSANLSLTTIFPFNQYDWPVPRGPAQFTRDWTWRQVDKLGLDALPVGKQVFDLPNTGPLRAIDLRNWIQSVNLALTVAPGALPFNQYDWPVPVAPHLAAQGWIWSWIQFQTRIPTFMPGVPDWGLERGMYEAAQRLADYTWTFRSTSIPPPIPLMPGTPDWPGPHEFKGPPQFSRSYDFRSPFIPPIVPPIVAGQYFLLQPHYINDVFLPAWTIVTEGKEVPIGWVPTLMVDPLNDAAVAAFYAAGPRRGYPGPQYDWQGWQALTPDRQASIRSPITFWEQSSPGMFKLTGLGASLPPVGV